MTTVPVGAFERYLDWFRSVADKLNIPNLQIVDESTAAALGYAVQRPGTLVLVIDFGGGTLDFSLVRLIEKGAKYPGAKSEPLTLQVASDGQREIRLDIGEVASVSQAEVTYDASGRMTSSNLVKQDTYRSL